MDETHPPDVKHVGLVGNQNLLDVLGRVHLDIAQPKLYVFERLLVGEVVHEHNAGGAAVVCWAMNRGAGAGGKA